MTGYRPQHPAWQSINDQVASKSNKEPSCYGHRNPRGILCRKCAWAETCKVPPNRILPPPPEEPRDRKRQRPPRLTAGQRPARKETS